MSDVQFDAKEIVMRIFKYLFEGLVTAVAAYMIPGKKLGIQEIVTIGIVAAATFSVLDLFAPSIGSSVRTGAGLVVGANLVGGFGSSPGPFIR
jgi:ABC-type Co2+ transport system permease subunit